MISRPSIDERLRPETRLWWPSAHDIAVSVVERARSEFNGRGRGSALVGAGRRRRSDATQGRGSIGSTRAVTTARPTVQRSDSLCRFRRLPIQSGVVTDHTRCAYRCRRLARRAKSRREKLLDHLIVLPGRRTVKSIVTTNDGSEFVAGHRKTASRLAIRV